MSISIHTGDLLGSEAGTLVNTVNCVGVMGKGIALDFKRRFPAMFADYAVRCELGEVRLGEPYLYRNLISPNIINFPTKDHWKGASDFKAIRRGLGLLKELVAKEGITSLAVPPLGCGNGGLEWNVVGPTLYRELSDLGIPVELYAPLGTPNDQLTESFLGGLFKDALPSNATSEVTPEHLTIVEAIRQIQAEPYHHPVGRIFVQKIAYFLTAVGIPMNLRFEKNSFGPYSSELKGVLVRLGRNELTIESTLGKSFVTNPGPTYPDASQLYADDLRRYESAISKVVDLMLRMTSRDAELAASVHYAVTHLIQDSNPSEMQVFEVVKQWKARRQPPVTDERVAKVVRDMAVMRWIQVSGSSDLPLSPVLVD